MHRCMLAMHCDALHKISHSQVTVESEDKNLTWR